MIKKWNKIAIIKYIIIINANREYSTTTYKK